MILTNKSGIYKISNLVDGKFYIGSAVNFKLRWFHHRKLLRASKHFNRHLQFAWNKYGEVAFEINVVEECPSELLLSTEQKYLDSEFKSGLIYNLNPVAYSQLGRKHSEETKKKMSIAAKGRVFTDEHKKALSLAWHSSEKSKEQNKAARALATAACIGRVESDETRIKKSIAHTGKVASAETRARMKDAQLLRRENERKGFDVREWVRGGMVPIESSLYD